jgi:hypothetical protein
LVANASGYSSKTIQAVVTPGNVTAVSIDLSPIPASGSGAGGQSGLLGQDGTLVIVALAVAAAAAATIAIVLVRRKPKTQ